ncbi:hypothetical protein LC55x_4466 [Lysobacter capsici]|nr:hypothetical protein LC55x_4466 [Lysobacter capsici]
MESPSHGLPVGAAQAATAPIGLRRGFCAAGVVAGISRSQLTQLLQSDTGPPRRLLTACL